MADGEIDSDRMMASDFSRRILDALHGLFDLFDQGSEVIGAELISNILKLDYGSTEFWQAVTSLELWGGSGSMFDQAFVGEDRQREEFNRLMLGLSDLIEEGGHANRHVRSANMVLRQLSP